MAFRFRDNRRHETDGQTDRRADGVQRLTRPPMEVITKRRTIQLADEDGRRLIVLDSI